jgi:microcystin-dependent protein
MGTRLKNFESTGVAPNGRLYAGDLNAMQDQYADQANFAQTVDVGALRVTDPTLQVLQYGVGEFRLTGAVRTDGILRGLGGLYAGAFTTTQRDAIPAGSRPFGLVILNSSSSRYEWNRGTDAAPIWTGLGSGMTVGTLAARPAASSANADTMYFANDDNGGTWYYSNGTTWIRTTKGLNAISSGTLSVRPAANSVPSGNVFVATDDHGGTSWETDGTTWYKMGGSIFGEWPIGSVMDWPYASGSIPPQALLPYGQAIARISYPELNALAAAAGYPHGAGDGSTTFNLPDYRGRTGIGKDDMGGAAAGRITVGVSGIAGITLGASGGLEGITLTIAQIPAHSHGGGNHAHTYDRAYPSGGSTGAGLGGVDDSHTTSTTGVSGTIIATEGGGGAHPNVQPSIVVNKIMRVL